MLRSLNAAEVHLDVNRSHTAVNMLWQVLGEFVFECQD